MKTGRRKTSKSQRGKEPAAARPRGSSAANLQKQLDEQTYELAEARKHLAEALEQQTATSEVLQVISTSPNQLQPVLNSIVATAADLCQADFAMIHTLEHGRFRLVAANRVEARYIKWLAQNPPTADSGSISGRVVAERATIHIPDVLADPNYTRSESQKRGQQRSMLGVPLMRGGVPIGVIALHRTKVRPFTDKQIALVTNFANQAVIAIENTRLLNELRKSLQQQTATADVLKVISSSPGELEPVFQAMLGNATSICGAKFGMLFRYEGGFFHLVASLDLPPLLADFMSRESAFAPAPGRLFGRLTETKSVIHVVDRGTEPNPSPSFRYGGARSSVAVPMIKDDQLLGALFIYRTEVRPFTDKQVELVQNFAAQAVIAIENTRLLNELRESLQQQTATADVLQIISGSPGELQPVFQAMLANATRICDAKFGILYEFTGDRFQAISWTGVPPAFADYVKQSRAWGPDTGLGQVVRTRQIVHIHDVVQGRAYTEGDPGRVATVGLGGVRSALVVPMIKENELTGAFVIYRQEVRPFTDKQIALVENFAAQAVIAIENARLLNELRQRTDDLSESLEQQTATSNVLRVISTSPGKLEPVFEALLANAVRVIGSTFGTMYLRQGDLFRVGAVHGAPPAYVDTLKSEPLFRPGAETVLGRVARTKQLMHVPNLLVDEAYRKRGPRVVAAVEQGGVQALLSVPMLKDNELVGTITIYRAQTGSFTDKQIELIQNFAAQAVIAIENARLLNELRQRTDDLSEALEQQTATSEVLKVISSSPGELEPVFEAMLANAVRICGAKFGVMSLREADAFRVAATHGAPAAFVEQRRREPLIRLTPGHNLDRLVRTKDVAHVADILADPEVAPTLAKYGGARALVNVPLLKDGELIGSIVIFRQEAGPFGGKQIELVQNFAAQAVIAIENTRLLNELRESLAQQTATADVLKVIPSSPGELKPVFQVMLENATQLCEARYGTLWLTERDAFRTVASHGDLPRADFEPWQSGNLYHPGPDVPLGRVAKTRQPVHVSDMREDPSYLRGDKLPLAAVDRAGVRTLLVVPMLRENDLVGAIAIYRTEVRPFSRKQIELVSNFAAQAVIAIENTRLLSELRESLQRQTATADVLKVISRSTFDLQTVLDTLTESAAKLCDAEMAGITRPMGDGLCDQLQFSRRLARVCEINSRESGARKYCRASSAGRSHHASDRRPGRPGLHVSRTTGQGWVQDISRCPSDARREANRRARIGAQVRACLYRETDTIGSDVRRSGGDRD